MKRFCLAQLIGALALSVCAWSAVAQYPSKPIAIIVPFAAGGGGDIITRLIASKMSANTGKSFVIENRGGAGGRIGTAAGIKAPADGYTLIFLDRAYVMMRALYGNSLPWDSDSEPVPVTLFTRAPFLIVASPKLHVNSLKDLIALAKAHPAMLNYGSSGIGSTNHIMGELLKREANIDLTHIPYKSMGEAINGMLSGSIDVLVVSAAPVAPLFKSGRIVPLAVASEKRLPALPSVPSVVEAGLPGFIADNWFGLAAPKGTPPEVIDWLQREVAQALAAPDIRERLAAKGAEPSGITPAETAKVLRNDTQRLSEVIRAAGIKGE